MTISGLVSFLKHLKKDILKLEEKLVSLVGKEHKDLLTNLETIPGIGKKTALTLIVLIDGFSDSRKSQKRTH